MTAPEVIRQIEAAWRAVPYPGDDEGVICSSLLPSRSDHLRRRNGSGSLKRRSRQPGQAFHTLSAATFTSTIALRVSTMTCAQSASSWLLAFLWLVEITTTS